MTWPDEVAGKAITIHVDGGARPNPGHGAAAAVVLDGDQVVYTVGLYTGEETSSNEAEHIALLTALKLVDEADAAQAYIYSDSVLAVGHALGEPVQSKRLRPYVEEIRTRLAGCGARVKVGWAPRETIKLAHQEVERQLADKPFIQPRETPRRRIFDDVTALLDSLGEPWEANDGLDAIEVGRETWYLLPYYGIRADGSVAPTIDEKTWRGISKQPGRVRIVWVPYGNGLVPMARTRVAYGLIEEPVRDHGGGVEPVLAARSDLELGSSIGRVGYNGSGICWLQGGPWRAVARIPWRTNAGNDPIQATTG